MKGITVHVFHHFVGERFVHIEFRRGNDVVGSMDLTPSEWRALRAYVQSTTRITFD